MNQRLVKGTFVIKINFVSLTLIPLTVRFLERRPETELTCLLRPDAPHRTLRRGGSGQSPPGPGATC